MVKELPKSSATPRFFDSVSLMWAICEMGVYYYFSIPDFDTFIRWKDG